MLNSGCQLWGNAWGLACCWKPARERGPSTRLFSRRLAHWSRRLSESTFRIDRIKYYKGPNGVTNRKWCSRVWLLAKTGSNQKSKILLESRKCAFRLKLLSFCKVENCIASPSPIECCVFAYGFSQKQVPTKSRKCYLKVESVLFAWGFCNSAESSMRWRFRKWCFHLFGHCMLRLLSFCTVEHTMALQKVVFPTFWALRASPSNHRPTSCLFTYVFASCSAGLCMPI